MHPDARRASSRSLPAARTPADRHGVRVHPHRGGGGEPRLIPLARNDATTPGAHRPCRQSRAETCRRDEPSLTWRARERGLLLEDDDARTAGRAAERLQPVCVDHDDPPRAAAELTRVRRQDVGASRSNGSSSWRPSRRPRRAGPSPPAAGGRAPSDHVRARTVASAPARSTASQTVQWRFTASSRRVSITGIDSAGAATVT